MSRNDRCVNRICCGSRKRVVLWAVGIGVVAFAGMQVAPVDRSNPPVTIDGAAPAEVKAVLRQSCYDCHSNETNWPWYSYIAPVSWLVAKDVREGREHLNFSTWDRYGPGERAEIAGDAYEESAEGEMPLSIYLLTHGDTALTSDDLRILRDWAAGSTAREGRERDRGHDDHDDD